jgi:hypothetical protein
MSLRRNSIFAFSQESLPKYRKIMTISRKSGLFQIFPQIAKFLAICQNNETFLSNICRPWNFVQIFAKEAADFTV